MQADEGVLDFYHEESVKKRIHEVIESFGDHGGSHCDLGRYSDAKLLLKEAQVVKDERGLGFLSSESQEGEEVIVSVTGVLVEASLPPYTDTRSLYATRRGKRDIPVNKVSLAWFGHDGYSANRSGLENLRTQFNFRYSNIDAIAAPMKCGMPIISCENRVVSKAEQVGENVPDSAFPKEQDPKGIIKANLLNSSLNRYVSDNAIAFAQLVCKPGSSDINVAACPPEEIKVGMIVCVQATPTVIPTVKGGFKLILKLRNILKINDSIFKEHQFKIRLNDISSTPKPGAGLKRTASEPVWLSAKRRTEERETSADAIAKGLQRLSTEENGGNSVEKNGQSDMDTTR